MSDGTISARFDHLRQKGKQYTTIQLYYDKSVITFDGYPVKYLNALYNVWAWLSPISPYTQYLRDKHEHNSRNKA